MNSVEPMLACGSMHLTGTQVALILFFIVAWWLSGALAIVNALLLSFLQVSPRFKTLHFAGWVIYVVPGIVLLLGLYDNIPLAKTPPAIWITYALAIPFVTVLHFGFLWWTRRKIRTRSMVATNETAA